MKKWVDRVPRAGLDGSYEVHEIHRRDSGELQSFRVIASCPSWEAAEAAARLLTGFAPVRK